MEVNLKLKSDHVVKPKTGHIKEVESGWSLDQNKNKNKKTHPTKKTKQNKKHKNLGR